MMKNKPFLYKIGVKILGPIYKWYYDPKIIGIENLDIDGPFVIASNHIHLYDQCNILISTEKFITYMAKKEYFDSKKTCWFFKGVGCIPVDRTKKDENAVKSALDVLNNDGYVGIFPEGTRNHLKSENIDKIYNKYFKKYSYVDFINNINNNDFFLSQYNKLENMYKEKIIDLDEFFNALSNIDLYLKENLKKDEYFDSLLLPFKFGCVSMAKKTNAKIIPVIIKGKYAFKSDNLKIIIGSPIDISKLDLSDANNKLREKMKKMLKEENR